VRHTKLLILMFIISISAGCLQQKKVPATTPAVATVRAPVAPAPAQGAAQNNELNMLARAARLPLVFYEGVIWNRYGAEKGAFNFSVGNAISYNNPSVKKDLVDLSGRAVFGVTGFAARVGSANGVQFHKLAPSDFDALIAGRVSPALIWQNGTPSNSSKTLTRGDAYLLHAGRSPQSWQYILLLVQQVDISAGQSSRGNTGKILFKYAVVDNIVVEKWLANKASATRDADVDISVPYGSGASAHDVAVIIGNRLYTRGSVPPVEYALNDARTMRDYLIKTLGFDPNMIIYEEDAGLVTFNEIFGRAGNAQGKLADYVKPGVSKVFVYYVGHGVPDLDKNESYLLPTDADPQYVASSGYRVQVFYDNLAKVNAKEMIVVLDACFSGNSAGGMLLSGINSISLKTKKVQLPKNIILFASARSDQVSTWFPEKKHSLFSYFFLKGLQGSADLNNDKHISVAEMSSYLTKEVPYKAKQMRSIRQHPYVEGEGSRVLTRLK